MLGARGLTTEAGAEARRPSLLQDRKVIEWVEIREKEGSTILGAALRQHVLPRIAGGADQDVGRRREEAALRQMCCRESPEADQDVGVVARTTSGRHRVRAIARPSAATRSHAASTALWHSR